VYLSNKPGGHGSQLTLGGRDPKHYSGNSFVWADVVVPSYWLVGNDEIYVGGKKVCLMLVVVHSLLLLIKLLLIIVLI
jgi:hypothetical protein